MKIFDFFRTKEEEKRDTSGDSTGGLVTTSATIDSEDQQGVDQSAGTGWFDSFMGGDGSGDGGGGDGGGAG
ncbi:MAG: hypothetical protein V4682_01675 [Patescibacteria group bacterium]